jgi:hypothetical protein
MPNLSSKISQILKMLSGTRVATAKDKILILNIILT